MCRQQCMMLVLQVELGLCNGSKEKLFTLGRIARTLAAEALGAVSMVPYGTAYGPTPPSDLYITRDIVFASMGSCILREQDLKLLSSV